MSAVEQLATAEAIPPGADLQKINQEVLGATKIAKLKAANLCNLEEGEAYVIDIDLSNNPKTKNHELVELAFSRFRGDLSQEKHLIFSNILNHPNTPEHLVGLIISKYRNFGPKYAIKLAKSIKRPEQYSSVLGLADEFCKGSKETKGLVKFIRILMRKRNTNEELESGIKEFLDNSLCLQYEEVVSIKAQLWRKDNELRSV